MTPDKNAHVSILLLKERQSDYVHMRHDARLWNDTDVVKAIWKLADCDVLRLFADKRSSRLSQYH